MMGRVSGSAPEFGRLNVDEDQSGTGGSGGSVVSTGWPKLDVSHPCCLNIVGIVVCMYNLKLELMTYKKITFI